MHSSICLFMCTSRTHVFSLGSDFVIYVAGINIPWRWPWPWRHAPCYSKVTVTVTITKHLFHYVSHGVKPDSDSDIMWKHLQFIPRMVTLLSFFCLCVWLWLLALGRSRSRSRRIYFSNGRWFISSVPVYMHTALLIPYFSFPWSFPSHRFYVLINYHKHGISQKR